MPAPAAASRRSADNRELVALARGGGLNFIGAATTQLGTMVLLLVLTRQLTKDEVGIFRESIAVYELLQIVALFGLAQALTRFVAVFRADRDRAAVRGTVAFGLLFATGTSLVVALGLYLVSPWISGTLYNQPELLTPLRYVAFALPPAAITMAALSACSGFRTMRPYAFVGLMLDPILRVALTALVLWLGWGFDGIFEAFLVVPYVTMVLSLLWLAVLMRGPSVEPRYEKSQILRFASMAWIATFTTQALLWLDQLILPIYVDADQVAIYGVATSLVVLATFAANPITQSLAPRVADLTRRKEIRRLGLAYQAAAGWITRFSLPFFAVIFIFPRPLLNLFGPGYAVGAMVTIILAIGKLSDTVTGPCGAMLNQAGLNKLAVIDNTIALTVNVGLNFLLIPQYGINGAAFAWMVSLVLVNTLRATQVKLYVADAWPFNAGTPKSLAAFAWSMLGALVVRELVDGSPRAELIIATPVVFGLYIVFILALGLTDEDKLVFGDIMSMVKRRGRRPPTDAPGAARILRPSARLQPAPATVPAVRVVEGERSPARLARRFRHRSHIGQTPGTVDVVLDRLVSPLRLDVVIRQEFFAFLDANADLLDEFGDLVIEAKKEPYFVWYRDVMIGNRPKLLNGKSLDDAFADQVERVLAIRARFNPADEEWGELLLRELPAGSRMNTGKVVGRRFVPVDGCHRIALLRHHGRKVLPAGTYRLVNDKHTSRDNTGFLIPRLHLTEQEYLSYLSLGYEVERPDSFDELVASVTARQPERAEELQNVLSYDLPLLLRQFGSSGPDAARPGQKA